MGRSTARRVLVAVLAALCGASLLDGGRAAADTAGDEGDLAARVNGFRDGNGLPGLTVRDDLAGVARQWAERMAGAGALSHNPSLPEELTAGWATAGETVGMASDPAGLFDTFVASQLHRDTMLRPTFSAMGVGVARSGGNLFVAIVFAGSVASGYTSATAVPKMVKKVVRVCSRNRRGRLVCVRRIRLVPA